MELTTRRSFLVQFSAAALASGRRLWAREPGGLVFAGTYTDKGGTSQGIYAYRWDADSGTMAPLGLAARTVNPSFLAVSPNRRQLYAVNQLDRYRGAQSGSVSSFAVDAVSGKLKRINVASSGGASPCKITVDFTGKAAFVANFDSGSVASCRVLRGGALSEPVSEFHYSGHGTDPITQASSHVHCTTVSPDNRYLLINDLGLDRISVFRMDPDTARLTPNVPALYEALPGSGPRSLAFHPSGRWAYSLNELASTLDALAWDSERGSLSRFQNISTLPEGFTGLNTAATVVVDSVGRFVYASNRGDNSVAVFAISDRDGTLKAVQHVSCGGKTPRHFALDPGNQWLVVANQDSSNVVVFARNARSGFLTPTGNQYSLSFPVCLVFH